MRHNPSAEIAETNSAAACIFCRKGIRTPHLCSPITWERGPRELKEGRDGRYRYRAEKIGDRIWTLQIGREGTNVLVASSVHDDLGAIDTVAREFATMDYPALGTRLAQAISAHKVTPWCENGWLTYEYDDRYGEPRQPRYLPPVNQPQ